MGKGEEIESDEEIALKRRKTESTNTEAVEGSLKIVECEEKNLISKYKSFKDKLSQNNNNGLQKQCAVDVYDFVDD